MGFTEGDGSFNVSTNGFRLIFSLTQADIDFDLMNKIVDFFNNNLPGIIISTTEKDKLLKSASCKGGPAKVYKGREQSLQSKGGCDLKISSVDYIRDTLIPFFEAMTWHSKKYQDFLDWKTILKIKDLGLHYSHNGLELINKIMNQMNSKRLSNYGSSKIDRNKLEQEIYEILNNANNSNYEIRDGRVWIKSLNRFQSQFKSISIKLFDSEGDLLANYPSLLNCSKDLGIGRSTLKYRLENNVTFEYEGKSVYLKKG